MAELKYYIKGFEKPFSTTEKDERTSVDIKDKPKIYFTCHPKDFDRYFEKVRCDLFKAGDCVIFYTEDMTEQLRDENREIDLERMNLFVMPVTFRMLTEPNRAMDDDFAFAEAKHISVLPLMMESGIDVFYAKRFGTRQYLEPYSADQTAVSYEDKLKNYFKSVFLDEEMIKRIRGMFDAYIFLSYRKKDRRYANELMRMIHNDPQLEKLAIWYDEFLTPTESFEKNISRIMHDCRLMTLLVTPNLLEKPGGKPNFVMEKEYPAARDTGKPVLPAEMVATDPESLKKDFEGIPDAIDIRDEQQVDDVFLETLRRYAVSENRDDPEHNYLIGLAYLDGIDVEVDRDKGVRMITGAAEAGLPEAMRKLGDMYEFGDKVKCDFCESIRWTQKLYEHSKRTRGEKAEENILILYLLGQRYLSSGKYDKALEKQKQCNQLAIELYGSEYPQAVFLLSKLSQAFRLNREYDKALKLGEESYQNLYNILGEDDYLTLHANMILTETYIEAGKNEKALETIENCYALSSKRFGENNAITQHALYLLSNAYRGSNSFQKAGEAAEVCYNQCKHILGNNHINTQHALSLLALAYRDLGNYTGSLALFKQNYHQIADYLGEEHPSSLDSLIALSEALRLNGFYGEALESAELAYHRLSQTLGESHPMTLNALSQSATVLLDRKDGEKAFRQFERCYQLRCDALGKEHSATVSSYNDMAKALITAERDVQHALQIHLDCYHEMCSRYGKENPAVLSIMQDIAKAYYVNKEYPAALEKYKQCWNLYRKVFGEKHPNTLLTLQGMATAYGHSEESYQELNYCLVSHNLFDEVFGEEHPFSIGVLENLSLVCNKYRKRNAVSYMSLCYDRMKKVYGEFDNRTQDTLALLLILYHNENVRREYNKQIHDISEYVLLHKEITNIKLLESVYKILLQGKKTPKKTERILWRIKLQKNRK